MRLTIPKDQFYNPKQPRLFLCNTGKKRLGELQATDVSLDGKWNAYSTLNLTVDATYVDLITGETKRHPLFDKLEGLRNIEVEGGYGYFTIQDPDKSIGDKESKTISAFSAEYGLGAKFLVGFKVNKGEVDSVEVMYNSEKFGENYDVKNQYTLAQSGEYDAYTKYYAKEYTDTDSYTYERVQIVDENDYELHFNDRDKAYQPLYVTVYKNVQFYNKDNQKLSLLHLILEKAPEWSIDDSKMSKQLMTSERSFDVSRESIYNFLVNDVTEKFNVIIEFDNITNTIIPYEATEDGLTEDGTIDQEWGSDVFISKDNLAQEISIQYSTDDIVTKLQVSGADDLSFREVNLGSNYIMNLDYYHNLNWMDVDIYEAYQRYLDVVALYGPKYEAEMQRWVAAYNTWNDMMNAVPVEGNVILVGDEFEKLYCTYTPWDTAWTAPSIVLSGSNINQYQTFDNLYSIQKETYTNADYIDKTKLSNGDMFCVQGYKYVYNKTNNNFIYQGNFFDINKITLINKLNTYHVCDDLDGTQTDNILLRLKNDNDDVATIRIYDPHKAVTSWSSVPNEAIIYRRELQLNNKWKYYELGRRIDNSNDIRNKITETQFNNLLKQHTTLYISDYIVSYTIYNAEAGINGAEVKRSLDGWLRGYLTVNNNDTAYTMKQLKGYKISYIGIMGSYLCLAKQETQNIGNGVYVPTEYLRSYGVKLLEEKHRVYTTIFQTQTEALFSKDKYQCVVSDDQPLGEFPNGTRWLDSNSTPAQLYSYVWNDNTKQGYWQKIDGTLSPEDKGGYEDYERYLDNFNKLKAVQAVLAEKSREANYSLNGHVVPNLKIDPTNLNLAANGQVTDEQFYRAAKKHFGANYTITRKSFDPSIPLYTFTTSFDGGKHIYAVYVEDKAPYVAYENSQAVHRNTMERYAAATNMDKFFTVEQWQRFSPFIREGEYSNDNILITGYESEEERLSIYKELLEDASKELKKISQPSLEFSMTMANILALPEFEPLISRDQFKLGKFIRIGLDDGLVKRARLLEVHLNFSDLQDFSCNFGNLVKHKDEVDKTADLLKMAIKAGQAVSVSGGTWNKAVEKTNKIEDDINNGLADVTLEIGKTSGQAIEIGQSGIKCRKLKEGTTDQYEDEQMIISNNKLVYSPDGWQTSASCFGKFTVNGEERAGVLADSLIGGYVSGANIVGGTIAIGDPNGTQFIVNSNGEMSMIHNGTKVADSSTIADIANGGFYVDIVYDTSTVFTTSTSSCELTAKVYSGDTEITEEIMNSGAKFSWKRVSNVDDAAWNTAHENQTSNKLTITNKDLEGNATITCDVNFDYK